MSQSLSMMYIHSTFGTKGRRRCINEKIAPQLHSYMAGIFRELDSPALIINSMPDHIHALFRMSKSVTVATLMEEVKKDSSKWMKKYNVKEYNPDYYWD